MNLIKFQDKSYIIYFSVKCFGLEYEEGRRHNINESRHGISNNVVCATSIGSDQPAHMRSLIRTLAIRVDIL